MKLNTTLSLIVALSTSSLTYAQSSNMGNMDMKGMNMKNCMDMKEMKGMNAKQCDEMMKDTHNKDSSKQSVEMTYEVSAIVKSVDTTNGRVTLAHEPVKELHWPAMTMVFSVKDKMLFDKLEAGKKVHVQFIKQDSGYVVTSAK